METLKNNGKSISEIIVTGEVGAKHQNCALYSFGVHNVQRKQISNNLWLVYEIRMRILFDTITQLNINIKSVRNIVTLVDFW